MKKDRRSLQQLVGEAFDVCFKNDKVTPFLLAKKLKIDDKKSLLVFEELEHRGIITGAKIINIDIGISGRVNRQQLKKIFKN